MAEYAPNHKSHCGVNDGRSCDCGHHDREIKRLTEENNRLRAALKEVSGCLDADNKPKLCEGCLLTIRCAVEGKNLSDFIKEARDAEKTGD